MDTGSHHLDVGELLLRERTVKVLQIGFRLAAVLIMAGLVLAAARQEELPHVLGDPGEIVGGLGDGDTGSVLGLGIVSVILTPLAATITIAVTFLQQGERRHAAIASVIVLILLVSLSLSVL